jgi:NodT family efflux transporter outer membrane factor (OMF) lipoprotein
VLAALLTAGCLPTRPGEWFHNGFKVGPNYERPPAPVPPEWIEGQDARVRGHELRDGDWWNVFQDPVLDSLIHTAYQQNLTLRAVGMRVLEARAQQAIAVGNFFPQTQLARGEYSRVNLSKNAPNNPTTVFPLLRGITNQLGLPPPAAGFVNNYSDWQAGFNLSWELDFWGRFRRAIESANASLDVSVENYDDALVTLLADVATNYVEFRVAQQRIRIASDNVRRQEILMAKAEKQFKTGTLTKLDVAQLRTLLEQTRSTIPALQIALGQANDTLCILLGLPPHDLEPELGPGPDLGSQPMPKTPLWVAAGIPADLLRRRPDVRSAERQVAAQSAQIGVAEADLYPTISVNGTLGWEAQDLSKLFESKSFFGTITPQLRWNILNYGRIVNNVRLQDARTQELIAIYQNKVLTAAREVQTALRGFLLSQKQVANLTDSAGAAVTAAEIQALVYDELKAEVNRSFTIENTKVQEQDNLAVAQGNIALNLINVYRALGGGWEIRQQGGHSSVVPSTSCKVPITGVRMVPLDADSEQTPRSEPVPQGHAPETGPNLWTGGRRP